MLKKLDAIGTRAYTGLLCFFQGLKEDERGLSGVVVAVLLILIAVLAISMLWGSLSAWLGELWEKITGSAGTISGGASLG